MGSRNQALSGPTQLLSSTSWTCPLLLQISFPPEDGYGESGKILLHLLTSTNNYLVVLRHGDSPKLLPLYHLQPKLEIPLEVSSSVHIPVSETEFPNLDLQFPTHPNLLDRPPPPPLLRHHLGFPPPHPRPLFPLPRLAHPHLCHLTRRPALVPNPLVHLGHRLACAPVPRPADHRRPPLALHVALARRPRLHPGHRLRHDPPADADQDARCGHVDRGAGAGQRDRDPGPSHGAAQSGSWGCVSQLWIVGCRSVEQGLVLGRVDQPAGHLRGLLQGVQEGTAFEAVT